MPNNKKSKLEICVYFFAIIGVIAAICFSGYQMYFLRKEFLLLNRPYLKVNLKPTTMQKKFLGVSYVKENFGIYYHFKKDKYANFIIALEYKNVGKVPARIEDIILELRAPGWKEDEKLTIDIFDVHKTSGRKIGYVIFPNETLEVPENLEYEPNSDDLEKFNMIFQKLEDCIKEQNFIFSILIKYTLCESHIDERKGILKLFQYIEKERVFKTWKTWIFEPGAKEGQLGTYYIE